MSAPQRRYHSHYRTSSRSSSRSGRRNYLNPQLDYKETFITQCIVCTVILAVVLFARVIHMPFSDDLRQSLASILSSDMQTDESGEMVSNVGGALNNMKNSVKTIFGQTMGEEAPYITVPAFAPSISESPLNSMQPESTPALADEEDETTPLLPSEFRIDEDILNQINSQQDYYEENVKKSEVPPETTQPKQPEEQNQ